MTERPRNIANDILDCVETSDCQVGAAEEIRGAPSRQRAIPLLAHDPRSRARPRRKRRGRWMERLFYMAASGNGTLPASARQIYYQARPR